MSSASLVLLWFLGLITPGLDFAVVTKNATASGRVAGIKTSFGVMLAMCIHFAYVSFLLTSVSREISALLQVIQFLGALFLLYLGAKVIMGAGKESKRVDASGKHLLDRPLVQGFLTNVLNPKVGLLAISFFSIYLASHTMSDLLQVYIVLLVMSFLWFSLVSVFWNHRWMKVFFTRYQKQLEWIMGLFFVFVALEILLAQVITLFAQ